MTREDMINKLAEYYNIDINEETGDYDLGDYDWQSGCICNCSWLSLANIVDCLAPLCDE